MYMTQIKVTKPQALQRDLYDNYVWHQELWSCFSPEKRPYQFRVDSDEQSITVMVLSSTIPQLKPWGQWATKNVPDSLFEGSRYLFSVRANPTVKRVQHDESGNRQRQGRRMPHENPDEWFKRKAQTNGFRIVNVAITKERNYRTRKGVYFGVDFEGELEVSDGQLFKSAVLNGFGSGKFVGFGLMLLRRIR